MNILPLISSSISGSSDDEGSSCPSLSLTQRLTAFGICTGLGWWIQAMSFASIMGVVGGVPFKFALFFTIGNVITILATCFLIGFTKQFKKMMEMDRRVTSIVYLSAIVATLIFAYLAESSILVLICIFVELAAYIWYSASYIPYGRSCLTNCFKQLFRRE